MTAARDGVDPCSAAEALARMQHLASLLDAEYWLGTGNYRPGEQQQKQYDCAGAAMCDAYRLKRHRPGFAPGRVPEGYRDQSDVDDDINTNSAIDDAFNAGELYEFVVEMPVLPGDLLCYPTLRFIGRDGERHHFIGHVAMVKSVPDGWKPADGYRHLRILQCCGPNGRKPAIIETDGSVFDRHDLNWPKPQHRTVVLRVRPA